MSAPSIPNLLSLRGGRGGRGGALRSRRGGGPGTTGAHHDSTIQGTDTDAAVSRLSAVDAGYLEDPYAAFFVSRMDGPPQRRFPIINRGTSEAQCVWPWVEKAQLTTAQAPIPGLRRWTGSLSRFCHPRQETQPDHRSDRSFL